mmetsp:Transcript_29329/g.89759  ORF Transcript_29329/g.89759 Transcript_29329/m.89759 type:complete len:367 (-) Transcript_29329:20-1120(-)
MTMAVSDERETGGARQKSSLLDFDVGVPADEVLDEGEVLVEGGLEVVEVGFEVVGPGVARVAEGVGEEGVVVGREREHRLRGESQQLGVVSLQRRLVRHLGGVRQGIDAAVRRGVFFQGLLFGRRGRQQDVGVGEDAVDERGDELEDAGVPLHGRRGGVVLGPGSRAALGAEQRFERLVEVFSSEFVDVDRDHARDADALEDRPQALRGFDELAGRHLFKGPRPQRLRGGAERTHSSSFFVKRLRGRVSSGGRKEQEERGALQDDEVADDEDEKERREAQSRERAETSLPSLVSRRRQRQYFGGRRENRVRRLFLQHLGDPALLRRHQNFEAAERVVVRVAIPPKHVLWRLRRPRRQDAPLRLGPR